MRNKQSGVPDEWQRSLFRSDIVAETVPTATASFTTRPDGMREFSLPVNDIVYNPADQLIYASVPSVAGSIGNSIAAINPATGLVGQPVLLAASLLK